MPKIKFTTQLADVTNLLDLADAITLHDPALSYLTNRPSPSPLLSGAIVLLCARFEEFVKDVATYALERHSYSQPPLTLRDLPDDLQVQLISKNLNTALQGIRYGVSRSPTERIREGVAAATHVANGAIDATYAIDTGGNPGPETVGALMKMVGIGEPWKKITDYFATNYIPPSISGISLPAEGPKEQLRQLISFRNTVSHSGASVPASAAEIRFNVDFLSQLSNSIFEIMKSHVEDFARSSGRTPAVWAS